MREYFSEFLFIFCGLSCNCSTMRLRYFIDKATGFDNSHMYLLIIEPLEQRVYIVTVLESAGLPGDNMHVQVIDCLSSPCPLLD